ncbi:high affinity glucose transporter [Phaeosphaeriaceae sp. PMI808]|nr:high affinity glucose transporter [Phaeosphaeriaceae sp. PMI808]
MYQIGNIYGITAIAVIGGGLFGFDISSMSAILPTQQYRCYFNQGPRGPPFGPEGEACSGPSPNVQGGITAAMPGGSFLGALVSGYLTDRLGRRRAIQIGCAVWMIGSIISCAAQNIGMLIAGRFINGFAVGICSAQVPVYVSELAPPSKRGRVVGSQQWAITWGILIMYYISYGCVYMEGARAFRIPWALQMVPAIVLAIGLVFLPESPRWLARHDRWEETQAVLTLVHGKGDPNSPFVQLEMDEIKQMIDFERQNADVSIMELFRPRMINRLHIDYITYVFGMAGLSGDINLIASSIQYIINVLMTVPALICMDRWGRRPMFVVGAILMAIWMFTNGGLMASYGHAAPPGGVNNIAEQSWEITGAPARAIIACTYLFVASYAPTWGPASWVYPPELFPLRVRGKAVALTTSSNWLMNFALSYFVPPAFVNIQWRVYIIFGVFCTVMAIHTFFMFPETAGKTLEDVEEMFLRGVPAWKTKVDYSNVRRAEQGAVDPEKARIEHSPERTENMSASKA